MKKITLLAIVAIFSLFALLPHMASASLGPSGPTSLIFSTIYFWSFAGVVIVLLLANLAIFFDRKTLVPWIFAVSFITLLIMYMGGYQFGDNTALIVSTVDALLSASLVSLIAYALATWLSHVPKVKNIQETIRRLHWAIRGLSLSAYPFLLLLLIWVFSFVKLGEEGVSIFLAWVADAALYYFVLYRWAAKNPPVAVVTLANEKVYFLLPLIIFILMVIIASSIKITVYGGL